MRRVIPGLAMMIIMFTGMSFAQEPPRVRLAVENCNVKPGEGQAWDQALQALVEHINANPQDLPGNIYGVFREVAAPGNNVSFALEVEGLGEFEDFILARIEANNSDERRGTLFRAWRSHLDEASCSWSFHLRMGPN